MAFERFNDIIAGREIIIWGTGDLAKSFYEKYSKILNIRYFTSNDRTETTFYDLVRVEPCNLLEIKSAYIVLCMEYSVNIANVESQLEMLFSFYKDYIEYDLFDDLYNEKKFFLLWIGVCQQLIVMKALELIPELRDKYLSKFYWQGEVLSNPTLKMKISNLSIYADYVITQSFGADNYYYLNGNAKRISIARLNVGAIFPQRNAIFPGPDKYYYESKKGISLKKDIQDVRAFYYTDAIVVKLYKQGFSKNEILRRICSSDLYSNEEINMFLKKNIRQNEIDDYNADIKLGKFFLDSYKYIPLCLDMTHYSDNTVYRVLGDLLEQIDEKIDLKGNETRIVSSLAKEDRVWENQMPIYPSVYKKLGLEYVDEKTKYAMVLMNKTVYCTFKEYMEIYIDYIFSAFKLEESMYRE